MKAQRIFLAALLAALPAALGAQNSIPADADTEAQLRPVFVGPLFPAMEKGRNDSSPVWSPDGTLLAFERTEEAKREIVIARTDGSVAKTVYYQANEDDLGLAALLPGLGKSVSYNSGIAWSPRAGRFVFMSNAGEGNYDLYLGGLASGAIERLTRDPSKDGQPHWSPHGERIAFVSGRDGGAKLFLMEIATRKTTLLSGEGKTYLYPRWSPDGRKIAAIYGENENHDIVVFDNVPSGEAAFAATQAPARRMLTTWSYDDLSPSWSPDGKRIAFYTNYNPEGDPKVWALAVVDAHGGSPTEGDGLAARIVARNVVPDVTSGPAWLPDGRRIAYAHNGKHDYSPIHIVDVDTKKTARLVTGTSINHDLAVSPNGLLAFRAQVDQWDRIFIVKLAD